MDLEKFQKEMYGNLDDDPELLAELEALSGETKPKPKAKPPPAQKQVTPAMLNQAMKDAEDMDFDDDELENDVDLQVSFELTLKFEDFLLSSSNMLIL